MIKVLKREITTFDLSENENDDESLSLSSPIISADESEQDEKNISESSPIDVSKLHPKKVIVFFLIEIFILIISHFNIFVNIHLIHLSIINHSQQIMMYQEKIHMILKVMMNMKQLSNLNKVSIIMNLKSTKNQQSIMNKLIVYHRFELF
jgi:hypothetical protein